MIIFAIETSCDETAVAILMNYTILSNKIFSQSYLHRKYGGIIPEIAVKNHTKYLPYIIKISIGKIKINVSNFSIIAVTGGPGLISGIIIGFIYAKIFALILNKNFIIVNHLEGHTLVIKLTHHILKYPYILVLMSGGHFLIILVKKIFHYKILSQTIDDSIGEIFDKIAQMLDLHIPGGPEIERYARNGNKLIFDFFNRFMKENTVYFSFSGLKTSIKNKILKFKRLNKYDKFNICASFQRIVSDMLIIKLHNIIKINKFKTKKIVLSGGVASNKYIRNKINIYAQYMKYKIYYPPINLCTDNAIMIAYTVIQKMNRVYKIKWDFVPNSKWYIKS